MLLILIVILTVTQPFVFTNAGSLLDLPLKISNRNLIIHATLTDKFLEEYISVNPNVQGKIEIESKTDSSEVHYSSGRNNQRLIVKETSCELFTYKLGWDKQLPGVTKPLLNLILLLGPSIIYRIDDSSIGWSPADDDEVRGTQMHSSTVTMNARFKMTIYYKKNIDQYEGITRASRIVFEGRDPGVPISSEKENLIMDIYINEETDDELDKIAQIPPGIGCPVYLSPGTPLPILHAHQIQLVAVENIVGPTSSSTRNEFYIDDDKSIMRLITTAQGVEVDAIYDYNLGLIHIREDYGCLISPLTTSSPGVSEKGYYSLFNLLWLDKNYLYLGQVDYEHRPGFRVKAWEATEYDITIGSTKYAKVVTTVYFSDSRDSDTFYNYVLVGAIRSSYKKSSASDYVLVETITRDFYDFKKAVSEAEFETRFQVGDCFPESDAKIELNFQLSCPDRQCYDLAKERPDDFRRNFKYTILNDAKISPLRISNVDLKFGSNGIDVFMTFLKKPTITQHFRELSKQINEAFLRKLSPASVKDEELCLEVRGSIGAPTKSVIYCNKGTYGNCYSIEGEQEILEDPKGVTCNVWDFPLRNLFRIQHELTLEQIHDNMLHKAEYNTVYFYGHNFKINNVIDVTQSAREETQFPFALSRHSSKFKSDPSTVKTVVESKTLHHVIACVNEDENLCESFSFCDYSGKVECLVSSLSYDKIDDAIVDDQCKIYSKNHLLDYHQIKNKRFKSPTSISITVPLFDCAALCYGSDQCYSFQFCEGFCTFAGYYTDSASEYSEECDIFSPKAAHKYQTNGDTTVVETFHTELNLNLEQCASLCNGWESDESCKSFNFCPKGRALSSCYLSKYTVRDGKTVKKDSNDCHNYELIETTEKDNKHKSGERRSTNGTSSGAAFGIIMLFLVTGLVVGLVVPIFYKGFQTLPSLQSIVSVGRSKMTSKDETGFGWSKQVDDEDQSRV
ncbi:LOW QUALITY PROTEIN: uncharacterized protein LOC128394864 [Panonychus citri]|uniref:LOW QUALITY PROTEIN: uncharacterized protein LOC128394864 n=1 Tax=Panonychus citri TaxID=50023 RepID=UPI0023078051|nr:LOW QUALITY PROTEIN: uncharacterized protein LOC128394864 [Panonychus citri]